MVLIVLNHSIHMGLEAPLAVGYLPLEGWGRHLLSGVQALGAFAVPLLLFVSGSFVAYATRGGSAPLPRRFVRNSVTHLLLPYLFWSFCFYLILVLDSGTLLRPGEVVRHLLVGYPFHFVPLLIAFYLLAPLLVPLVSKHGGLLLLAIGLYQLFLLNLRDPAILGFALPAPMRFLAPPVLAGTLADWAIYFPAGMVFATHSAALRPHLYRFRYVAALGTAALFALGLLDGFSLVNAPLARYLCPFTFLLLVPLINRKQIPQVRRLESIGKRSYGLYLTHLIVLAGIVLLLQTLLPQALAYPLLLLPLLFIIALQLPLFVMNRTARPPTTRAHRLVFG